MKLARWIAALLAVVACAGPARADGRDPRPGRLEVRVEGCPCTVRIDGQDAGTALTVGARMATFEIAAGVHRVEITRPESPATATGSGSGGTLTRDVRVRAGARTVEELELPSDPRFVAPRLQREIEVELPPGLGPKRPDDAQTDGLTRRRTLAKELPYGCRAGLTAVVVAVLEIDTTGRVSNVAIVSEPSSFDGAVRTAMGQRLYSPATSDGVPSAGTDLELFRFSGGVAENDTQPGGLR